MPVTRYPSCAGAQIPLCWTKPSEVYTMPYASFGVWSRKSERHPSTYRYQQRSRLTTPKRALIAGGGAPEIEIAQALAKQALSLSGTEAICWKGFADAMEVIPTTLAENAGLNSIKVVTELRHRHAQGEKNAGVSIRSGGVKNNMAEEKVLQPLLVSTSAIELAAETVKLILRIDDIALSR